MRPSLDWGRGCPTGLRQRLPIARFETASSTQPCCAWPSAQQHLPTAAVQDPHWVQQRSLKPARVQQQEHQQERCAAQVHRYEQQGERPPSRRMRAEAEERVLLVEANQYGHRQKLLAPPRCPGLRSFGLSCVQELRVPDEHQMNPSQPGPRQGHRPQPSQLHQRAVREYPPSHQRPLQVLLHRHQQ